MITKTELEEIINRNIKEIPYEGAEIDKYSIIEKIFEIVNKPSETTKEYPTTEQIDNALDCLYGDNSCNHSNVINFLLSNT